MVEVLRKRHRLLREEKARFEPEKILSTIAGMEGRVFSRESKTIFGRECGDSVFYIRKAKFDSRRVPGWQGSNPGILSRGEFFGEVASRKVVTHEVRNGNDDCELLRIDKKAMTEALHRSTSFPTCRANLLAGTCDTKRIWWTISSTPAKRDWLGSAVAGSLRKEGIPEPVIPKISQATLAEMIAPPVAGQLFMNRFRKSGFVDYGGAACRCIVHF